MVTKDPRKIFYQHPKVPTSFGRELSYLSTFIKPSLGVLGPGRRASSQSAAVSPAGAGYYDPLTEQIMSYDGKEVLGYVNEVQEGSFRCLRLWKRWKRHFSSGKAGLSFVCWVHLAHFLQSLFTYSTSIKF